MNDNWIDDLLDAHLHESDNAQPALGMESRILARISEGRKKARGTFLWMAWASAAIIVFAVALWLARENAFPVPAEVTASKTVPPLVHPALSAPQQTAARFVRPPRKRLQARIKRVPDLRPDVFPSPSPLSEQERLALAYLQSTPRSELIAMSRPDDFLLLEMNQRVPAPDSVPKPFNSTR